MACLLGYRVLDTDPELPFDDLVRVASHICGTPIALVSLVDRDRQWFKAKVGLDASETPRDLAFCAHAILDDAVFEVQDTLEDPRFATNPLVTSAPAIRFYAGAPLIVGEALRLGTLCVIDRQPRALEESQRDALRALARQVVAQLDLRKLLSAEREIRAEREQLIAQLQEVADFRNRLLATVSHEMRTPLTAMKGSLQLVAGGVLGALPEQAQGAVEIAHRSTERLARLTNDLLDLEKLGSMRGAFEPKALEPQGMLRKVAKELEGLDPQVSLRIVVDPEAPEEVYADPDRIQQVLVNLVGNAVRFSPVGGTVTLRLAPGEQRPVRFEVSDEGPGISEEDQGRLFRAFSQVGSKQQRAGGAGLGLAICRSIAELHRARLGVVSEPGEGATFYFEL